MWLLGEPGGSEAQLTQGRVLEGKHVDGPSPLASPEVNICGLWHHERGQGRVGCQRQQRLESVNTDWIFSNVDQGEPWQS
jgi:hypothetical protein